MGLAEIYRVWPVGVFDVDGTRMHLGVRHDGELDVITDEAATVMLTSRMLWYHHTVTRLVRDASWRYTVLTALETASSAESVSPPTTVAAPPTGRMMGPLEQRRVEKKLNRLRKNAADEYAYMKSQESIARGGGVRWFV